MNHDPRFFSHWPVLQRLVLGTTGSVLELGCGWGSTPFLHMLCTNRRLLTIEKDAGWLCVFEDLKSETHELSLVDRYDADHDFYHQEWAVALIDQDPEAIRWDSVRRLRGAADYMIFHDIEQHQNIGQLCELAKNGQAFKRVEICRTDGTTSCTAILTDRDRIPGVDKGYG